MGVRSVLVVGAGVAGSTLAYWLGRAGMATTVVELAEQLGLRLEEADLAPYDAYNADEAFLTSTSLCICPVVSFNGKTVADGKVPGPITQKLIDAYSDLVDCDVVGQYLRYVA